MALYLPVERRADSVSARSNQQKTIAGKRRLRGNFTAADGRDIAAVKVANLLPSARICSDVNRSAACHPISDAADLRRGGGSGLFLLRRPSRVGVPERVSTSRYIAPVAKDAPLQATVATGFHRSIWLKLDRASGLPALLVRINSQQARTLCYHCVLTDKSAVCPLR